MLKVGAATFMGHSWGSSHKPKLKLRSVTTTIALTQHRWPHIHRWMHTSAVERIMDTNQDISHAETICSYILFLLVNNLFTRYETFEQACQQFNVNVGLIMALYATHYLNGQDHHVPKSGQMHLAWDYAQNPANHQRFANMLCVSPLVFWAIVTLIKNHPVFTNSSNVTLGSRVHGGMVGWCMMGQLSCCIIALVWTAMHIIHERLYIRNLHHSFPETQSLTAMSHIYEFDLSIPWVLLKDDFNAYMDFVYASTQNRSMLLPTDGSRSLSYCTISLLM